MTGQDFFKEFQVRISKSYSRFVDTVKAERLFKRALYSVIDQTWAKLDNQKPYDELKFLITTEKVVTPKSNNYHKNKILLSNLSVSSLTYVGTTATITTIGDHNFSIGDTVTFTGAAGLTTSPSINSTSFSIQSVTAANVFTINFTTISGSYTANSAIVSNSNILSDYLHLFSISCKFEDSNPYDIVSVSNSTPVFIELSAPSTIRSYDKVTISGYSDSGLNTDFYVNHHTDKRYSLYYDEFLTNPVPASIMTQNPVIVTTSINVSSVSVLGNFVTYNTASAHTLVAGDTVTTNGFGGAGFNITANVYSVPSTTSFVLNIAPVGTPGTGTVNYNKSSSNSGGVVKKIYYRYATPMPSDQKIQVLEPATVSAPKFEMAENSIAIMPFNRTCIETKIDYLTKPKVFVDPTNNILDLETIYPAKFLYRVISEAVVLYSSPTRDQLLESSERREIQSNP